LSEIIAVVVPSTVMPLDTAGFSLTISFSSFFDVCISLRFFGEKIVIFENFEFLLQSNLFASRRLVP